MCSKPTVVPLVDLQKANPETSWELVRQTPVRAVSPHELEVDWGRIDDGVVELAHIPDELFLANLLQYCPVIKISYLPLFSNMLSGIIVGS